MLCTGCGKKIPFTGDVCPYCHRDKSQDQSLQVGTTIFGAIGGGIGYMIDGFFWGAIIGVVIGVIAAFIVEGAGHKSKPPIVRISDDRPPVSKLPINPTSNKLAELKDMLNRDLISLEEFEERKRRLLDDL